MNIEKISVDGHYVWVDNEIQPKNYDYQYSKEYGIQKCSSPSMNIYGVHYRKIIAASPELKLTDVPTYVKWLARREFPYDGTQESGYLAGGYIIGYQAAKKELLDVDDMKELIVSQQLTIQSLQKRVGDLQDSNDKRQEWLTKAKREAGVEDRKSFDDVWKEMLNRPTWDDIRKAIEMSRDIDYNDTNDYSYTEEEIIEQLKSEKTK